MWNRWMSMMWNRPIELKYVDQRWRLGVMHDRCERYTMTSHLYHHPLCYIIIYNNGLLGNIKKMCGWMWDKNRRA